MRHAIVLSVLAAAAAPIRAQTLDPVGVDPRAGLRVDTVIATVNNDVIMLSELRTQAVGEVRTLEAQQGRRLTPEERGFVLQRELTKLINNHTMAQAAKTLGLAAPDMIESLFQDELRRAAAEQVRNLGTEQKFSQELQRQGRTWQSFEREQRVEKMRQFAEELAIYSRLQKQQNLFLTPRMMRELYEREIDRFVRPSLAIVSAVVFRGDDAPAQAAKAIEFWRTNELSSRELADRYPGATAIGEIDAGTLVPELPLAKFALAGPQGAVSAPIPFQGGLQVAKVVRFIEARNASFGDPDVQTELRRIGLDQVVAELRQQALARAAARTEVLVRQAR
ncbi:MAG: peptidyl-prolyl cis-trans isomerase [Planctomycetes bacterium]|nr:peptidyl-prolyl cis-trans isomerase [Planctomycetota bacterium]MCB9886768.1 peptidyl-prolyl cis-trans isomerase [Planctomycetota bacterium]